jgi:hypothetical protein
MNKFVKYLIVELPIIIPLVIAFILGNSTGMIFIYVSIFLQCTWGLFSLFLAEKWDHSEYKIRVELFVALYDFWIGFYYDRESRAIYICIVPCVCLKIFREK